MLFIFDALDHPILINTLLELSLLGTFPVYISQINAITVLFINPIRCAENVETPNTLATDFEKRLRVGVVK